MTHETEAADTTGAQPVIGGVTALLHVMGDERATPGDEPGTSGSHAPTAPEAFDETFGEPAPAAAHDQAPTARLAGHDPVAAPAAPDPRDAPADAAASVSADPDDAASPTGGGKPLPFPVMHGRERGYRRDAVEAFMARAREAFERGDDTVDARAVRQAGFPLVRGGYQIAAVDAALGRIEDAFAARERQAAIAAEGPEAWVERARAEAQVILERLARPAGRRFDRVGPLSFGYAPKEVDIVADRISAFLQDGDPLTAEQVRSAAFRMSRGGYREEQVDALLDAVVDVILAVR
ncbi:DivIVA domain-containing protein [Microbacterium petrolearium]